MWVQKCVWQEARTKFKNQSPPLCWYSIFVWNNGDAIPGTRRLSFASGRIRERSIRGWTSCIGRKGCQRNNSELYTEASSSTKRKLLQTHLPAHQLCIKVGSLRDSNRYDLNVTEALQKKRQGFAPVCCHGGEMIGNSQITRWSKLANKDKYQKNSASFKSTLKPVVVCHYNLSCKQVQDMLEPPSYFFLLPAVETYSKLNRLRTEPMVAPAQNLNIDHSLLWKWIFLWTGTSMFSYSSEYFFILPCYSTWILREENDLRRPILIKVECQIKRTAHSNRDKNNHVSLRMKSV